MRADSLSARIFLTLAGLLCVVLAVAAFMGEGKLRKLLDEDLRERRIIVSDLLSQPATDVLAGRADRTVFAERLRVLGGLEGLRLTLIQPDGSVMADSEAQGPLANHAERPEILDALTRGSGEAQRTSTTTGKLTNYRAQRLEENGKLLGCLRVATESERVEPMVASIRSGIAWFGVAALLIGLVCVAFIARWLANPMKRIEREAAALAAGNLDGRIHDDGPLEVRRLAETLNAMSRELRTRLESQRRARTEIETILASMAEGVVAVDDKERVLLMNRAASELLGLPAPLESGAQLWESIRFPELERSLRAALAGGGAWHGDATSPRQDGRMLSVSVAPVAASSRTSAALHGAVALMSDVTAIRRLEQVRIDFVANVSHELRTPLAAVIGALETLDDPEQGDEVRVRFLDIAHRNAARLQAIVSDLLDLSSIEAEGDRMAVEPVRIDAPLRTAASALSGAAEAKGVKLDLPPLLSAPVLVNGNNQRLEQVFTNLLENAIKYTPSGGRVSAHLRPSAREVSIDVQDTGVGIPKVHLPRVFERFYRVDRSRSRDMGGTGLGLAIVKHVLRAHGGQVSVKSEEGRGTTFTVTLPRLVELEKQREN